MSPTFPCKPCTLPQPLGVGLHFGIPDRVYHADPCEEPSLSSGVLRTLIGKTPSHAYLEHVRLGGTPKETTPAMALGGYTHALLSGLTEEFEVADFENYLTKDAKAWRDSVKAAGKTPILEKMAAEARAVATAVMSKGAVAFAANDKVEATVIWQEDEGIWCRARIDRLGGSTWWDFKTAADISDRGIERAIVDRGYAIQEAFYQRGLNAVGSTCKRAAFLFVESEAPYSVRIRAISEEYRQWANAEVEKGIALWRKHLKSGDWSDPKDGTIAEVPLPHWLEQEIIV